MRENIGTRLSLSHCTMAWYVASFESAPRKKSISSLECPVLAGACISWRNSARPTWSRALIPCEPWSGSGSPICGPPVLLSSFWSADLPLPLDNDPTPGPTASPKYSSSSPSEDVDDEQSSPARFGLFPLALQVSFLPMSFLLSCGSHPEKMRPTSPSFWWEVQSSQRVKTSSWQRWDGSRRRIPSGRSSALKKLIGDCAISFQCTRALGFSQ